MLKCSRPKEEGNGTYLLKFEQGFAERAEPQSKYIE